MLKRICFFTVGDINFASSRTRVFQYLPFLHADGVKTTIFSDSRLYAQPSRWRPLQVRWHRLTQRLGFLLAAPFHDVVFLQKVVFPRWYITLLTWMNPRFVFDLDDAIYTTSGADEIDTTNLDFILSKTKVIFAENDEVVDYVSRFNPNVANILGPIDCTRYRPRSLRPQDQVFTIGWVGSPSTEKYLFLLKDAFVALKPGSYRLVCIGVKPDFAGRWGLPVETRPWTIEGEVAILDEFDVGIMPLPDDRWSRGKGGYKLLQYMAMGIPSVTSPIGVNTELVEAGRTGYLATNTEEWISAFQALMASPQERESLGREARRRAEERYSFEHHYLQYKAKLDACVGAER